MNPRKVALVTGAGKRRVGAHVADALVNRGYSLVIHYRSSATEANEAVARYRDRGVEAVALQADLSDEKAVQTLVAQALAQFGRLDVLVNCAAAWNSKRLEDATGADVRQYFETNTLGTFLCSQHAGLTMVKQKEGGSIITIGDWATVPTILELRRVLPIEGSNSDNDARFGRGAGHAKSSGASQLHHARPRSAAP